MAYLKIKDYGRVIEDASQAIKLKEDYLKAYHRRGKAYQATNKFELAIRDFQYILDKEPGNKEVNKDLEEVRKELNSKLDKPEKKKEKENFVRVAIEEESDEEEGDTEATKA